MASSMERRRTWQVSVLRWLRPVVAGMAVAVMARLAGSPAYESGVLIPAAAALGFIGGMMAGSLWGVVAAPLGLLIVPALLPAECPGCQGSEPLPVIVTALIVAFGVVVPAVIGALGGVYVARVLARVTPWRRGQTTAVAILTVLGVLAGVSLLGFRAAREAHAGAIRGTAEARARLAPTYGTNVWTGRKWDGRGDNGDVSMSEDAAARFTAYDLFWLGPSFGELNLDDIRLPGPARPPEPPSQVALFYGACRTPCGIPLQIQLAPICAVAESPFIDGELTETTRGGGVVRRFSDRLAIWTGGSMVHIRAPEVVWDDVIAALVGLNNNVGATDDLPLPDFSGCPERLTPVRRDGRPAGP